MKKIIFMFLAMVLLLGVTGCFGVVDSSDAQVASHNLSKAADQFEIYRRVVFYNGITDTYMLTVEGYCSIKVDGYDGQLELTVKTDDNKYLKHFLGLSDNVTYFIEQLDAAKVSDKRYRVIFKPSVIIPNIDLE